MLDRHLYYYCELGKNPPIGKIRACCVGKGCPHMKTRPRKKERDERQNRRSSDQVQP